MHRQHWFALAWLGLAATVLSAGADDRANPSREAVELRARKGLPNFFAKARGTNPVTVAYFGGSITAADGWRPQSLGWLRTRYSTARFNEVNAAIGGTGSDLGVFRLQRDVLSRKPDLVFVEFAVNDGGAAPAQIYRCMEGIVRQIWNADPATDICFVYTLHEGMTNDLAAGRFPRSASAMEHIADHYGIPSIHLALEAARRIRLGEWIFSAPKPEVPADAAKGTLARKAFASDGCHPFAETGHRLYTEAIARDFEQMESLGQAAPHALGEPFTPDNHEHARMILLDQSFLSGGWGKLDPATNSLARNFSQRLPSLWQAGEAGATLTFSFHGKWACVYDLLGPDGGELEVAVDDRPPVTARRFDAYCTYHRLGMLTLLFEPAPGDHRVTVRLTDKSFDKAAILRRNGNTMDKPERFAPLRWQAGAILLDGELKPGKP